MLSALSNEPKFYTLDQLVSKSIFKTEYYVYDLIQRGLIKPVTSYNGVMLFDKKTLDFIIEEQIKNLA